LGGSFCYPETSHISLAWIQGVRLVETQVLRTGGVLTIDNQSIVCRFEQDRLVLSTSPYNGGYLMADAVYNYRLSSGVKGEAKLLDGSIEKTYAAAIDKYGLNDSSSTGLLTCAQYCLGYSVQEFEDIVVEVVVNAGIGKNAFRAGDMANYYKDGDCQLMDGKINILAFTNVSMSHGAMAKAMLSITEAKTAVLQELMIVSSTLNIATGTGADGIIIACDPKSTLKRYDVGTDSKLGELFCRATKEAIRKSLAGECNITSWRQGAVEERFRRLGIEKKYTMSFYKPQDKLLLAISQAVWQEYRWGLIGLDELYHFFELLDSPSMQPVGGILSLELRKKMAAVVSNIMI